MPNPLKKVLEADTPVPALTHEHVPSVAGEAVRWLEVVADQAEGLERRGGHGPIVGVGCLLARPRRERGSDDSGRGGIVADSGGGRSAIEDHLGSVVVECRGHDLILKLAGY